MYHLAGGDAEAAREYLQTVRRNKKDDLSEELGEHIRAWKILSPETVAGLIPDTPAPGLDIQRARAFLVDRALKQWIVQQNMTKALAPSGRCVDAARKMAGAPGPVQLAGALGPASGWATGRAARQWIKRFAKRCSLQLGGFKPGPRFDAKTALEKADLVTQGSRKNGAVCHFLGPNFGTTFWPKSGAAYHGD